MGVTFLEQNGTRAAGDREGGTQLNQLIGAFGLFIDDDQTIIVADTQNHRIVEWERNTNTDRILAGANGQGNETNQLNSPTKAIVDKQNAFLIICDAGNHRIVRWPRRNEIIR